jgi:hypothetical protein
MGKITPHRHTLFFCDLLHDMKYGQIFIIERWKFYVYELLICIFYLVSTDIDINRVNFDIY